MERTFFLNRLFFWYKNDIITPLEAFGCCHSDGLGLYTQFRVTISTGVFNKTGSSLCSYGRKPVKKIWSKRLAPGSSGSRFFLCLLQNPYLNILLRKCWTVPGQLRQPQPHVCVPGNGNERVSALTLPHGSSSQDFSLYFFHHLCLQEKLVNMFYQNISLPLVM